jgi:hypothetical protein
MKNITRLGMVGAFAGVLAFGGCSTTNSMLGRNQQTWTLKSEGAGPSVEGKVQVAASEHGNRDLKVEAKHLAPPAAAFTGMSTYVVWLKPEHGHAINIGTLSPDKDENAKLETKTAFTAFEITVTAEETAAAITPSSREVLSADVQVAT